MYLGETLSMLEPLNVVKTFQGHGENWRSIFQKYLDPRLSESYLLHLRNRLTYCKPPGVLEALRCVTHSDRTLLPDTIEFMGILLITWCPQS